MKAETDQPILKSIQRLTGEEHRLFAQEVSTDTDHTRLSEINAELDQCWDLLRQRQALRDAGGNPNKAHSAAAEDRRKLRRMI
jgi:cell division GTPase FtsZ